MPGETYPDEKYHFHKRIMIKPRTEGRGSLCTGPYCDMLSGRPLFAPLGGAGRLFGRKARLFGRLIRAFLGLVPALLLMLAAAGCGEPPNLPPGQVIRK